jgi:hypothetical protein
MVYFHIESTHAHQKSTAAVPPLQMLQATAPMGENPPEGHSTHVACVTAPGDAEKLPAGQGMQAAWSAAPTTGE